MKKDSEPKMHRWQYDSYEVLNITPCTGYLAVWAVDCEDGSGECEMWSHPVDALSVARVTTTFLERPFGSSKVGVEYAQREVRNKIVGLELLDGWFDVVQDADNFAGLCREGDDIQQMDGCLKPKYHERLRKPPATTEEA